MGKSKKRHSKPRKKKEKIRYIDDGSTVVDLSGLSPARPRLRPRADSSRPAPRSRAGQIWETYKQAVRAMVGPMLIFIGGMTVVFLLVYIIFGFFV